MPAWVAGLVPSLGVYERQPHIDISLPLSAPCPLTLKSMKKLSSGENLKKYVKLDSNAFCSGHVYVSSGFEWVNVYIPLKKLLFHPACLSNLK